MRDMRADQRRGQRSHADLVAAVADRDASPRAGQEQFVERRGEGADVLAAHVARRAVGAAPAAFDRERMGDAEPAPQRDRVIDGTAERHHVQRDIRARLEPRRRLRGTVRR